MSALYEGRRGSSLESCLLDIYHSPFGVKQFNQLDCRLVEFRFLKEWIRFESDAGWGREYSMRLKRMRNKEELFSQRAK